ISKARSGLTSTPTRKAYNATAPTSSSVKCRCSAVAGKAVAAAAVAAITTANVRNAALHAARSPPPSARPRNLSATTVSNTTIFLSSDVCFASCDETKKPSQRGLFPFEQPLVPERTPPDLPRLVGSRLCRSPFTGELLDGFDEQLAPEGAPAG